MGEMRWVDKLISSQDQRLTADSQELHTGYCDIKPQFTSRRHHRAHGFEHGEASRGLGWPSHAGLLSTPAFPSPICPQELKCPSRRMYVRCSGFTSWSDHNGAAMNLVCLLMCRFTLTLTRPLSLWPKSVFQSTYRESWTPINPL